MMALLLNVNDSVSRSYSITKPSPLHPIEPSECGERTENLFDGALLKGFYQTINDLSGNLNIYRSFRIQGLPAGTYTVAWAIPVRLVRVWRDNTLYENVAENITSYTVNTSNGDIAFSFRDERSNVYWDDSTWVMLNLGSTPLPYEPYGYKLPLTSAGQNVDIYLGESQTTRQIKKLVLTGEEDYTWYKSPTRNYSWYLHPNTIGTIMNTPFYCSHGETVTNVSDYGYGKVYCDNTCNLGIFDSSIDTTTKLKNYFAQQYANGTPVTIWYVLATDETGTLNEPLRKIGNYADTIDSTQTTAQIPTSAGSTTIGWAGSGLAPSEFDSIQEWVDIPTYKRVNGEWVVE